MSERAYIDDAIRAARKYGLQVAVFLGLIKAESNWNPRAGSPAGAQGLGQLMPGTAAGLGVDPWNPAQNLDGSARYLRQQVDRFGGDYKLALAAYNAGPSNVEKYGGIPPFAETRAYVPRVLGYARSYKANGVSMPSTARSKWSPDRDKVRAKAAQLGLRHTSGDRSESSNRGAGGVSNSQHLSTRTEVWADDYVGSNAAMNALVAYARGLPTVNEAMVHDAGSGLHAHIGGTSTSSGGAGGGGGTQMVGLGLDDLAAGPATQLLDLFTDGEASKSLFRVAFIAGGVALGAVLIGLAVVRATGARVSTPIGSVEG